MKKIIHTNESRGLADHGWLVSRHTFSFAEYFDPQRIHFGALRVLNDDVVSPSRGFGTHSHNNMEIVSIPLSGSLKHKDSMENEHIIKTGEVQIMSAGTGILHSEYNNSNSQDVNFLQIWILPKQKNIKPRYEQKLFSQKNRLNQFQIVVSPNGQDESLSINQDCYFSLLSLQKNKSCDYKINHKKNGIYFFVIDGNISLENEILNKRDAMGLTEIESIAIKSHQDSEILAIEVPMLELE